MGQKLWDKKGQKRTKNIVATPRVQVVLSNIVLLWVIADPANVQRDVGKISTGELNLENKFCQIPAFRQPFKLKLSSIFYISSNYENS